MTEATESKEKSSKKQRMLCDNLNVCKVNERWQVKPFSSHEYLNWFSLTHLPWAAAADVEDAEELALGPTLGPISGSLRLALGPGGPIPWPAGCGMPGEVGAMALPPAG